MSGPQPKTKAQELIELINKAVVTAKLSEFQYHRCRRMLASIESTESVDWLLTVGAIIEMYGDNPRKALELAKTVLDVSSNVKNLSQIYFIFINCQALALANQTVKGIIDMSRKQNINPRANIPTDFRVLSYFLCGEMGGVDLEIFAGDLEHSIAYAELTQAQNDLGLSSESIKKINEIVFECFNAANVRCRKFEYSFLDGEFLTMLYIDKDFDFIRTLDSEIFSKCFKKGVHGDLDKLSYFILPFDEEVHNDAS